MTVYVATISAEISSRVILRLLRYIQIVNAHYFPVYLNHDAIYQFKCS